VPQKRVRKEGQIPRTRCDYLLKRFRAAQALFLATPTADPDFTTNIVKTVLITSREKAAIELGTANFIGRGFADEAIDLLLMTDNWKDAVSMLVGMGRLGDAAIICRVEKPSEARTMIGTSLAKRMITLGMHAYAMVLLREIGDFEEIVRQFTIEGQPEQAEFMRRAAKEGGEDGKHNPSQKVSMKSDERSV
jgi:hypothetical protein